MERDTLYFDCACGMCRRSTRILRSLDWLGRLRVQDMMQVPEQELPVHIEEAMQGIPMRTRDGRTLLGFPAMRRALMQTPLGALFAWAMYIPGISHLGDAVYRHIAANRARACTIDPMRSQ
jgi:predicted DCC family thiol-disulfide oxidoreductase YuxK